MPGLPNRTTVPPPNVTMAYHQAGNVIQAQSNSVWNSNYSNSCNNSWTTNVPPSAATTVHPVRQTFDVIARRRNPHYWTAGSNNPVVSSPAGGNSPLTPTPTPSPATPSPISPTYPNRPVSVRFLTPFIAVLDQPSLFSHLWTNNQIPFLFLCLVWIGEYGLSPGLSTIHFTKARRWTLRRLLFYG